MFKALQRVLTKTSSFRTYKYVPEIKDRRYVLKASGEHDLQIQASTPDGEERIQDVLLCEPEDIQATAIQLANAAGIPHKANKYRKALNKAFSRSSTTDIKQFLPEIAREYTNHTPTEGSPNCWNAVLVWHDSAYPIEYTDELEIEEVFKLEYVPIPINELRVGDVIAFRDAKGYIAHAAIYITKDIVWHKPGYTRSNPWTFETFNNACKTYHRKGYLTFHRKRR